MILRKSLVPPIANRESRTAIRW